MTHDASRFPLMGKAWDEKTTEIERLTTDLAVCVEALEKIAQDPRGAQYHDRAHPREVCDTCLARTALERLREK